MDNIPCVSFIGIVDFSQEARWIYMTDSVSDLLGYEPHELVGRPSLELVHPDEFGRVRQLHYDTINQDKAAVLVYLRMKHKDPYKGYILCGISRTVVHNVLVGSVSFASPGAKALHNASTAQEITVISPSAHNFQFRRWHDPSPMPPSPVPTSPTPAPPASPWQSPSPRSSQSPTLSHRSGSEDRGNSSDHGHGHDRDTLTPQLRERERDHRPHHDSLPSPKSDVITFDHLPNQSFRTAFILDRFSKNCTILYCSNDLLISTTDCIGRPFYDYVSKRDEDQVRSWVDCVKGWGVNERGQPSDGGFGFGRFVLITEGRDSIGRLPDPEPSSRRSRPSRASHSSSHFHRGNGRGSGGPLTSPSRHRRHGQHHRDQRDHEHDSASPPPGIPERPTINTTSMNDVNSPQFPVDAIFSAHSDGLMVILRRATS